jgi:hypothetical protein
MSFPKKVMTMWEKKEWKLNNAAGEEAVVEDEDDDDDEERHPYVNVAEVHHL